MRWTRWFASFAVAAALGATAFVGACSKQAPGGGGAMTAEDKIARGRYLAAVTGCGDCHTPGSLYGAPDTTRLLSGSELGWQGPWGVSYARNLTPDQPTGIGAWTEAQIVTAIREGRRPDGSPILPPMPWPDFAHFTDDDAAAIAAYLKGIPSVDHKVPDRIPPGAKLTGAALVFPPPPAWDAQNLPPSGGAPSGAPATTDSSMKR